MVTFNVEKFSGPLDLLLKLIEKEELDITQISLSKIADQYIEYIHISPDIHPEEMADFLVLAARLLFIKSKALFPFLVLGEDEESAEDLECQLKMYREYLEATKTVAGLIGKKKFMFSREFNRKAVLKNLQTFSPPQNLKSEDMAGIFEAIVGHLKAVPALEEKRIQATINIEEKIRHIRHTITNFGKTRFSALIKEAVTRTEVIVSFLALLELIKQRTIAVEQTGLFDEIEILEYENMPVISE